MDLEKVKIGIDVKITSLGETKGFLVVPKHLKARGIGKVGEILGFVPGHGGDVWWIKHGDDSVGAYCFNEFEMS